MIKLKLNLPKKRFHLSIAWRVTKREPSLDEQVLPSSRQVRRALRGNKLSGLIHETLHKMLDHKRIRKVIGTNLALLVIASSFIPSNVIAQNNQIDDSTVTTKNEPLVTLKGVSLPLRGKFIITQGFWFFHPGIDFDGKTGDPIYPISAGKVEALQFYKFFQNHEIDSLDYGNAILVDHGNGYKSLYAHLSKIYVKEGDEVTTDTELGEMGSTGRSTGDHLHLEVRDHGRPINPLTVLPR